MEKSASLVNLVDIKYHKFEEYEMAIIVSNTNYITIVHAFSLK